MVKPVLMGKHGTDDDRKRARRVLLEILDRSLRLLHPFMPFITEEVWLKRAGDELSVMVAPCPIAEEVLEDREAERVMKAAQGIITTVRNVRAERGFTPKDRFKLYIRGTSERDAAFFHDYSYLFVELARLTDVITDAEPPAGAHQDVVEGFAIAIEFPEKEVTKEQLDRVQREIDGSRKELAGLEAKLSNEQFMSKAPAAIV